MTLDLQCLAIAEVLLDLPSRTTSRSPWLASPHADAGIPFWSTPPGEAWLDVAKRATTAWSTGRERTSQQNRHLTTLGATREIHPDFSEDAECSSAEKCALSACSYPSQERLDVRRLGRS